jgi:hypothetical protein
LFNTCRTIHNIFFLVYLRHVGKLLNNFKIVKTLCWHTSTSCMSSTLCYYFFVSPISYNLLCTLWIW